MTSETELDALMARLRSSRVCANCADAADAITALRAEVEALRADIERHVQIAADQATEIEELRALLREARPAVSYFAAIWSEAGRSQELLIRIDAALAGSKP